MKWLDYDGSNYDVKIPNQSDNGTEIGAQKKWLDNVNKPCPDNGGFPKRRCLGQRTDLCIHAQGKFLTLDSENTYLYIY